MLHLWFAKIDNLTEVPIYFITNFSVFQKIILLLQLICLGGGTGRRAGFKIQFLRKCGFDSRPRYKSLQTIEGFFYYTLYYQDSKIKTYK